MMEPRSCVCCFAQPNFKLSQDHQEDGEAEAAAGGAARTTAGPRRAAGSRGSQPRTATCQALHVYLFYVDNPLLTSL